MIAFNLCCSLWVMLTASILAGKYGRSNTWKGTGIMFWCIFGAVLTILAIWFSYYQTMGGG